MDWQTQFLMMIISDDSFSATLAMHRCIIMSDSGHKPGISSEQSLVRPTSDKSHALQLAK